jgi:hypothetical protein
VSRKRKRRPNRRASRAVSEKESCPLEDIWIDFYGRRMFVIGYTSGGAPYGVFEDEMDDNFGGSDASEGGRLAAQEVVLA